MKRRRKARQRIKLMIYSRNIINKKKMKERIIALAAMRMVKATIFNSSTL